MEIARVDTIRLDAFPNLVWVQLLTRDGLTGLGETFYGAQAVEAYIHEAIAPRLSGADCQNIEGIRRALLPYVGYQGAGAEMRAISAIDLALWDLNGKAIGRPVCVMLGGAARDAIPVYNTCAGYNYMRSGPTQEVANWGLPRSPGGPYEDLYAFLHDPGELAGSLLEQGITGMKIWPFDPYAEASQGMAISPHALQRALEPFAKIRAAVGTRIDLMVELHGLWSLPAARTITHALEEFQPFWYEDPMRPDRMDELAIIAKGTRVPIATGETLVGVTAYRELLRRGSAGIVIVDPCWSGGISEARRVGFLAESHGVPVAPHDCTGPVSLAACAHLAVHLPNAVRQEFVRAQYYGWYQELVTELPPIIDGQIRVPAKPGLGLELLPDVTRRPDIHVRSTRLG